jgi:septal ring factor EnvC (AmiA/AmiB activator)
MSTWVNIIIPVAEAVLFVAPFVKFVYSYGQKQQRLEDEIKHVKDRLDKTENNHLAIATMISNIQQAIAKLETKLDFLIEKDKK